MSVPAAATATNLRSRLSVLRDMVVFVEVGRHENFTRAAKILAMPLSTVARRIALLEEGLGMLLLERTTRHQRLTADGRRFFERCRHVVDDALSAYDDVHAQVHGLKGHVHVSMSEELGGEVMDEAMAAFLIENPGLELHVERAAAGSAHPTRETDMLICTATPPDSALVTRQIGDLPLGLYAAPGYLRAHGEIQSRQALQQHSLLIPASYREHCESFSRKAHDAGVNLSGQLQCETIGIIRALAVAERGVALLPPAVSSIYVAAGRLVPVLPTWVPAQLPILAVTASRLLPMRLQALVEFLSTRLSAHADTLTRPSPRPELTLVAAAAAR